MRECSCNASLRECFAVSYNVILTVGEMFAVTALNDCDTYKSLHRTDENESERERRNVSEMKLECAEKKI